MIYIVIDNSNYERAAVLGVYKEWKEAEDFILAQPADDAIDVITWDIVRNVEVG
jgi:hypothetical protein